MSNQTITVKRSDVTQVAELAHPGYRGPQHRITVTESHRITASDLCPQGGSWSEYVALRIQFGVVRAYSESLTHRMADDGVVWQRVELTTLSPWSGDSWGRAIPDDGDSWGGAIPDDVILVAHTYHCGKDMGLTYYVSPTSQFLRGRQHLLPAAPADLSPAERVVLEALCSIKSGYRHEEYIRAGLSDADVEDAVIKLCSIGFVKRTKTGATSATIDGQNARRALAGR